MPIVGMVKMTVHQIIDVVTVRHGFVPASGAVLVACLMGTTGVIGRAVSRVRRADREAVLIRVVLVGMMEMPIVQVIGVIRMAHGHMTAVFLVNVLVVFVSFAGHH